MCESSGNVSWSFVKPIVLHFTNSVQQLALLRGPALQHWLCTAQARRRVCTSLAHAVRFEPVKMAGSTSLGCWVWPRLRLVLKPGVLNTSTLTSYAVWISCRPRKAIQDENTAGTCFSWESTNHLFQSQGEFSMKRLRLQGSRFFMDYNGVAKSAVIKVEVARNPLLDGCARTPLLKRLRADLIVHLLDLGFWEKVAGFVKDIYKLVACAAHKRSLHAPTILDCSV